MVIEDRYSGIFKLNRIRPALVADGIAELQVRWPTIPIIFAETRRLAEEWTYRYLAAAHTWAGNETAAATRIGLAGVIAPAPPMAGDPSARQIRAWARSAGLTVSDRGRLRPEITQAWHDAHRS